MVIVAPCTEVPVPEFPSKQTISEEPGTAALFDPPDEVDQFVFPVAAQVFELPPPTQYRVVPDKQAESGRAKINATRNRTRNALFLPHDPEV